MKDLRTSNSSFLLYNFGVKEVTTMSQETLAYLEEMNRTYFSILEKDQDGFELSEVDILFLEAYERTIGYQAQ